MRSDALVGIPVSALGDISWLVGFAEVLAGPDPEGRCRKVLDEVKETVLEAIERGEVVEAGT